VQEVLTGGRRIAFWLALALLALPSRALDLGPVEVLSGLGERLDARIPVRTREGEWFHATCLSLTSGEAKGLPALADGVLSVERRRNSSSLRVRSGSPVNEPAFAFGVTSTCAGTTQPVGSVITVLLDPPGVRAQRPAPRRSAMAASSPDAPLSGVERPRIAQAPAEPPRETVPAPLSVPAAAVTPPATAVAPAAGPQYVLRLTSVPIDLTRTRQFDDKTRAVLRERLRLLDSDDQVAAMLSMRDNLRRLEARVAELQLKLASMPQAFGNAAPAKATAAPSSRPAPSPAVAPASPKPTFEPAPAALPGPPAAKAPVAPAAPTPSASVQPPGKTATETAAAISLPSATAIVAALESTAGRAAAAGIAILAALGLLGWWLWSRWRHPAVVEPEDTEGQATMLMEPDELADEAPLVAEAPIELAAPVRAEMASDASLATRLEENTESLRRRYIEERFPEIRGGTLVLDDQASVVKGARLFYEDGSLPRAVELLRFATEDRPDHLRPWLALFEIYRLERLAGEYAELAGRFRDRHGSTELWPKVRAFGRELDPANPLYQEPPMKSLETIGPREARRLAAAPIDPIAENWLEAPMDFENEVLATELRRALMSRAAVQERDLVPNPMPALRSVEMFSVA